MQTVKLATVAPFPPHQAPDADLASAVVAALGERKTSLAAAFDGLSDQASSLSRAASVIINALTNGGRVLVAGNGGSAAEAQHFAAELVGRFKLERDPFAAIALTADTAILTALANDYGYEEVFARQVAAHGHPGDVFVAFSTSGESQNLVRAAHVAVQHGIAVVAITGGRANRLVAAADIAICAPSVETPLIQELHAVVLHILCELVESSLMARV